MKTIYLTLIALFTLNVVNAQIPKLNSYPAASAVLFLDFDGQLVRGTAWNWNGDINALPSGLSNTAITEIFNRVAEDYRIFNLNITTDSTVYAAAPATKRNRVVVTPTYQWYGQAGGVAYVGSFVWGDDTPAWVFSGLLNNNVKYVAEAISHELGHTLGLQHQSSYDATCAKTAEYSGGQGTGEISWAPIMGVGYYKNLTTWSYGPNTYGCSTMQNDVAVIAGAANGFGLRSDDFGNTHTTATPVTVVASMFQTTGLINTAADKDVFRFDINTTTNFKLNAAPQSVGNSNSGANIDVRVSLLNAYGDTLSRYNPTDLLNAGVDTNLNSSTYYLVVEGVGNANLADYGSLGFYNISGTLASTLPVQRLQLAGTVHTNDHTLNWNYVSDESISQIIIESSSDGRVFHQLAVVNETASNFRRIIGNDQADSWYRLKIVTRETGRTYVSNTIVLRSRKSAMINVAPAVINNRIQVSTGAAGSYELWTSNGALLQKGLLMAGTSFVETGHAPAGVLILRIVENNRTETFRVIK